MNDDRIKFLIEKYSFLNKLPYGFECGDGWLNLIGKLCEDINNLPGLPSDFKVQQIKQKFGGLRFYCGPYCDGLESLIRKAEIESFKICEECGDVGSKDPTSKYWIQVVCEKHRRQPSPIEDVDQDDEL